MDRRERSGKSLTAMLAMLEGHQAGMWTALPAVVTDKAPDAPGAVAFDPERQTCTCVALIQARAQNPDGTFDWISIPPLLDVPVVFPSGGGCTLTFGLKNGDEGLVIIASRCIDAWWLHGWRGDNDVPAPQVQMEFRMHDLSDGFFIPGPRSLPNVIPAISPDTAQFRTDTGNTYVELVPDDSAVNVVTTGDVNADAGGSINAQAGGDINATAEGAVSTSSGGETHIVAAGGCVIDAETTINGNTEINGNLHVNGHISFTAGISGSGSIGGATAAITGDLAVTAGNVTADGVGLKTHHHTGVQPGGGNSGGPVG
jgi:phage baseplate assembly protein gpV